MCKESFGKEIMNILDIIFPRRCPLCDEVIPPDEKSARSASERQNWCRNRSVNGAENPL